MAITIHQQPSKHSAIGSKLVIIGSSTNSGNSGFMYAVNYTNGFADAFMYVAPNPHGRFVFDPTHLVKPYMRNNQRLQDWSDTDSVHSIAADPIGVTETPQDNYMLASGLLQNSITIEEAWNVNGVLTINTGSEQTITFFSYNAQLSLQKGLNYDYLQDIGYQDGLQSRIMSDRLPSTHFWPDAAANGLGGDYIYIPAYESDWGQWSIRQTDIDNIVDAPKVRLSLLPNSGPPVQIVLDLNNGFDTYNNCGLWPANINASPIAGIPKPQDYPNWKAIYFQVLNDAEDIISQSYIMYNAARFGQCYNDEPKIRLAWVGRRGGWEYFNFCQNSFEEYATEKKIAHRAIGNYGDVADGAPFSFNSFDESEIVTDMAVQKFVNASSDWIQDGEREFLKGLFLSKQVHWVQDDGSHIPVIVQSDGYQVKKVYGRGPLFKLDIKVKIAQEQFN